MKAISLVALAALGLVIGPSASPRAPSNPSEPPGAPLFAKGDRIIIAGNTFAERLALYGYVEAGLRAALPELDLTLRNLGWSADEVDLMPRPRNFGSFPDHLRWNEPNVVLLCYGMNESFAGEPGLTAWRTRLTQFLAELEAVDFGGAPPHWVLVSPVAHEDLGRFDAKTPYPRGEAIVARNAILERYTQVMREVAAERGHRFLDLFTPTQRGYANASHPWTINGIHLNEFGTWHVAREILRQLGVPGFEARASDPKTPGHQTTDPKLSADSKASAAGLRLREAIVLENREFFRYYRPLNPYYIWGGRAYCWKDDEPIAELERIGHRLEVLDAEIRLLASADDVDPFGSPPVLGAPEIWERVADRAYDTPSDVTPQPPARRNGALERE